jgi:L-ribulokinase
LEEEAAKLKPGQSGLLALDWWNGCRTPLVDANLSGVIVGATLGTRAPDLYRALIEATAFGTQTIVETFEQNGVAVNELVACGGLAERNKLLLQIYADVTGREFKQAGSGHTSALGAAMFGAYAAGHAAGGFDALTDAASAMAQTKRLPISCGGVWGVRRSTKSPNRCFREFTTPRQIAKVCSRRFHAFARSKNSTAVSRAE